MERIEFETYSASNTKSKPFHDSEYYAAKAMATDLDVPVWYRTGINKESVEEWLEKNKPSTISKQDGFGWIWVVNENQEEGEEEDDSGEESEDNSGEESKDSDVLGLQDAWESLVSSGRHITKENIFELARNYDVTSGKWMFWVTTGAKGDHLWSLVAKGVASGNILPKIAKISATDTDENSEDCYEHLVCIYNDAFLNKEQVLESEHGIRTLGVKCQLHYKPDVFTHLRVYRNNPWNVRPTIYSSKFDIKTGQSVIEKIH